MTVLRTMDDLPGVDGRRVLVRVDFNVPLEGGKVTDDTRLREALPTLRELAEAGARVVLASHCGRPKGAPDSRFSLRPVAARLGELLEAEVDFAEDCVGEVAREAVAGVASGGFVLLENLRFHAGETANDETFAGELAALAEIYVGDAFGAAHRAHASVVGVPRRLEPAVAGRLLAREVEALERLLEAPEKPFAMVVGGAKIEGKIDTLENLLGRVDHLLLGGGMANTFLAAQGLALGGSLVEADKVPLAASLLERADARGVEVHLPADLVLADGPEAAAGAATVAPEAGVPEGKMALDIGEATRAHFAEVIARARTLFWNGPMGVFEKPPFDAGTRAVAAAVGSCPGYTVIGGGETVAAAGQAGVTSRIGHVSTGGGASLELLAGRPLPGVQALEKRS
jgi:phosphoglycerate kinase